MNLLIFCFFGVIAFAIADTDPYPRGCIYVEGRCFRGCEEGTHSYGSPCSGEFIHEATCDDPDPKPDPNGAICDFTACYCDSPTVRDKSTNKCVPLDQCPKKEQ